MIDQKLIHLSTKVHVFSKLHYLNNYKCYTQSNAFVKLTSIFYERVEEFHCVGTHIVALSHNLLTVLQLEMITYLLPGRIFIEKQGSEWQKKNFDIPTRLFFQKGLFRPFPMQ